MSNPETRRRLIERIAEHQFSGRPGKLKLAVIASEAGISRQAFNRYYGDLKPYITGERPIGELMGGTEATTTSQLLIQNQSYISEMEAKLAKIERDNQKALIKALDNHTTTLMNNDIAMMESNAIRVTLERQNLHVAELLKQVDSLEMALTRERLSMSSASTRTTGNMGSGAALPASQKLVFNIDLEKFCGNFAKDDDFTSFLDAKDDALDAIISKINKLDEGTAVSIALYAERYLSNFKLFAENYQPDTPGTHIIIRTPVYQRSAYLQIIKSVIPTSRWIVYVPTASTPAVKQAQRKFWFSKMPTSELKAADNAELPRIEWGFEQVIQLKVNQGE